MLRVLFARQSAPSIGSVSRGTCPPYPILREKLGGRGMAISDSARDLLGDRTGGHPWCVMEMASEAWVMRGSPSSATRLDALHVLMGCHRA